MDTYLLARSRRRSALAAAFVGLAVAAQADDWPQFRGANRDSIWMETGILQAFPPEGLKVRWRVPVGWGLTSPSVARGRVYLIDSKLQKPKSWEGLHCWDEKTGQLLWSHDYEITLPEWAFAPDSRIGPGASPTIENNRVYSIGATAQVLCLEATTGAVHWQRKLTADYGLEEFSGNTPSPLIEGNLLILVIGGKPDACVVALDKNTGQEVWRALSDKWTYSSPIVINAGGQRQIIVWTPNAVTSLDPATGKTRWREELAAPGALASVATPVWQDDRLLISGLMFHLDPLKPSASVLWPAAKATSKRVLSQTSNPIILGDFVYGGKAPGRLVCLDARTGQQLWATDKVTTLSSGATIQLTPQGGSALIFTDQGNLIRARLSAAGYQEISRVHVIDPSYPFGGRKYVWAPPAYANGHIFARSDDELVCASLEAKP